MKLAHARIVTQDVRKLTRFYREVTGLTPVGDDQHYVEFHGLGLALAISSERMIAQYGRGAAIAHANRSMILDFEATDVDAEHARLRDLVGHFILTPTTQPWGDRSMMFRDPDGNLINVFSPPVASASA
jgi:catechol 2,3-dioxygenase-like lactoylglutathione lyase family enzyme